MALFGSSSTIVPRLSPEEERRLEEVQRARQTAGGPGGLSHEEAQRLEAVQRARNTVGGAGGLSHEEAQGYQYGVERDPLYGLTPEQAAQYGRNQALEDRFGGMYSWLDPAFQMTPAFLGQSAGSQAGPSQAAQQAQWEGLAKAAGLSSQDLKFMSPDQQQALLSQWAGVQAGQGAPDFTQSGARQAEQYGNLGEIIAGGGASAIELARRQAQRADSEAWLRGQREADMADYAERGLTGSGMELQNLAMDRQAAAGRNSLADAQMAAELEKRRMDAINNAAGLAGQMRGAEYGEKTYLDQRAINALNEQTDLASLMRNQQAEESIANRNAQQAALDAYLSNAGRVREAEASESQYRATSADDFATWNANTLNAVNQDAVDWLRKGYSDAQQLQTDIWKERLRTGVDVAQTMQQFDQRENIFGFGQGTAISGADTDIANAAADAYRKAAMGTFGGATSAQLGGALGQNALYPQLGEVTGKTVEEIIKAIAGYGGGGAAGAGAAVAGGSTNIPDVPEQGKKAGDDLTFDYKKYSGGGGWWVG